MQRLRNAPVAGRLPAPVAYKHGRRLPAQQSLTENRPAASREQYIEKRIVALDRLVEEWNRRPEGQYLESVYAKSPTIARNTALLLENQRRHMLHIRESGTQISSAFGTSPENVLRIVRIGVANSNRADVFTEWALTSVNDALFYVDGVYGTSIRGATAGNRIYDYGAVTADYGGAFQTINGTPSTGDGATTTFTGTFSPTNIKPHSVQIVVGNAFVGTDDGAGNLIGTPNGSGGTTATVSSGTVSYTAGTFSVTLTTAPALGVEIRAQAVWDAENSANYSSYNDIQLKVYKRPFHLMMHPIRIAYSKMSELTFETTGLGDFDEQIIKRAGDEMAKRRDFKAFQLARRVAGQSTPYVFDADPASGNDDNDFNHAQRILTTIDNIGGDIFDALQRGEITKIVGNPKAVNYFRKNLQWKSASSQQKVGASYLAGKLADIDVYVTPSHSTTVAGTSSSGEAICVYKNAQEEGEPSLAFGTLTELSAGLDYPQMYREVVLAHVEGENVIQPGFIKLLQINNIK